MIIFVFAQDKNGLIGNKGTLPWHLPNDLAFFKKTTLHQTIVMGRKTFEGMGKRLLPYRHTIILTTDKSYQVEGAEVCHCVQDIMNLSQQQNIYIVGGAKVFSMFADNVDMIYQTIIDETFDGDAYMPKLDMTKFELIERIEGVIDEKNAYPHYFLIYKRHSNKC
ncbi:dihydrofolate reductase [Carnobacteriaceae bacterium zg-84]|uniref:dihydrofolate reductase n=1 Tax=Granulicatella sp. zg-84 TaxID=2678503 RepID=UPI0013BF5D45|nr:dihydrofolate reductase [Granulicatella sp. zg-84]NEW66329.1 dihydrofolate reductase [Granulicatella sp. zg-84]QMI85394.1 dihydrofolate reductase [Carnobacteriaceae bacterium zg-84]